MLIYSPYMDYYRTSREAIWRELTNWRQRIRSGAKT